MSEHDSILINTSKRIIKIENALSSFLLTGTDKIRNGYGNGDCVLIDFNNRLFAVSDATERHPSASRQILGRLRKHLSENDVIPDNINEWQNIINSLFSLQEYHFKATFSCVAFNRSEEGLYAYIMHGGDSQIMVIDCVDREIRYSTKPDMNFAGRSTELNDVTSIRINSQRDRILLATDGFNDVMNLIRTGENGTIPDILLSTDVHEIAESIYNIMTETDRRNRSRHEYDDIAVIVIDPGTLYNGHTRSILMGGTMPNDEVLFNATISSRSNSTWISDTDWQLYESMFNNLGITV